MVQLLFYFEESKAAETKPTTRRARVQWKSVPNAVSYEFELGRNPQMDPRIFKKTYPTTQTILLLPPGTYFFRIRGLDKRKTPGPWTAVQGFVVNPHAPETILPKDGQDFHEKIPASGIKFEWKSGIAGTDYLLEIKDDKGVLLSRTVKGKQFEWMPRDGGSFQWRVGFDSAAGKEWSPYSNFDVGIEALTQPDKPKKSEYYEMGRRPEVWSILRIAGNSSSFNGVDGNPDANYDNKIGTSLSTIAFSGEFRWRLARKPNAKWFLVDNLYIDYSSGNYNKNTETVLRVANRFFVNYIWKNWRAGPFIQVGIFDTIAPLSGDTKVVKIGKRFGFGPGGVVVLQAGDNVALSLLGVYRFDMGGTPSNKNISNLDGTSGFEFGGGTTYGFHPRWIFEIRGRYLRESIVGVAPNGSETSISVDHVIADIGLGYRF